MGRLKFGVRSEDIDNMMDELESISHKLRLRISHPSNKTLDEGDRSVLLEIAKLQAEVDEFYSLIDKHMLSLEKTALDLVWRMVDKEVEEDETREGKK
jgi:hypothetical protein